MTLKQETNILFAKERASHYYSCGTLLSDMCVFIVMDLALASPNLEEWEILKYSFEGIKTFYKTRSVDVNVEDLYKKFSDRKKYLRDLKNRMNSVNG